MKQEFIDYLTKRKESCLEKGQQLMMDERKDEANHCKVEANIYDIFTSLYQTACSQAGSQEDKIRENFMELASKIPMNWRKSYETAKEHGDSEKMLIEQIKLAAVDKIMVEYSKK